MDRRQPRPDKGANEEVRGDSARDQGDRPASFLADDAQKDRGAVEAHPPAEGSKDKSSADHAPAVESAHPRKVPRAD